MVKLVMLALVVAACTPDIASGTYLCGPEQLCPEGFRCNAGVDEDPETIDNLCVLASDAQPFSCGNGIEPVDDDVPTSGRVVGNLECVSGVIEAKGCLTTMDIGDWIQFDVPNNCTAVQIEARVVFPIAFEQVAMQISSDDGAPVAADTPCLGSSQTAAGDDIRCFKQTVENGSHQAIGILHTDVGNCGGQCANNRYTLSIQLSTP